MTDDLKHTGEPARSRINLHEPSEADYWTKALGVSKSELERIIAKVGNSADAVRKELERY